MPRALRDHAGGGGRSPTVPTCVIGRAVTGALSQTSPDGGRRRTWPRRPGVAVVPAETGRPLALVSSHPCSVPRCGDVADRASLTCANGVTYRDPPSGGRTFRLSGWNSVGAPRGLVRLAAARVRAGRARRRPM